ncbi:ATP-binding protein [Candidatus Woesearchaeota archaeon]|nr:ATP-binding protein [Candidatus Woesearchaeota archaeon]
MILGNIVGKTTTLDFKFLIKDTAKKFQYVQALHKEGYYILAQILEIEKDIEKSIAICSIIGYNNGTLKKLTMPLDPGSEVLDASEDFIRATLSLNESGALIGKLNGKENVNVNLDLNKLLTKHLVVLAKTGSGKSYATAVLIEELLEKKVPVLIIDPHNEYNTLKYENQDEKERLFQYGLNPKKYILLEYAINIDENRDARKLKLNINNITASELIHLLPAKLSNIQMGLLYSALKNINKIDFDELIMNLEVEDNSTKFILINIIDHIKRLEIFSSSPTNLKELIQPGKATTINLQGIPDEIKEIVVYKLAKDLFEERKKNSIAPFFFVVEEAQNFVPERNFKETKCSSILRQIVAEGRKFGISVATISQRPSRIDKNIIANASTQIILKVTNPNDIRAIVNSIENITLETEKEIVNMPIGTAMITGIADIPLFVDIRPRKSMHGGKTILLFNEKAALESEGDLLLIVKPTYSAKDMSLIKGQEIKTTMVPCLFLECIQNNNGFNLLINLNSNEFVLDIDNYKSSLINMSEIKLSTNQQKLFDLALNLSEFKASDLFAKSGLMFSEVHDGINSLTNKGIFMKLGEKYKLNEKFSFFTNLINYATYSRPDYEKINPDAKLDILYPKEKIIDYLKKFIEINDCKECFLVKYQ